MSSALATGRTSGGDLTLKCESIVIENTTIKADGGRDQGKAGNVRLEATNTLTLTRATVSAVGASGGTITLHGAHLIINKGTLKAFGKAPQYAGAIWGEYSEDYLVSELSSSPLIQFRQ